MRRKPILIALMAMIILVGLACIKLMIPFHTIRQLETRYQQVQPGMSTNEVQSIMNYTARWHTNATYRGWGELQPPNTMAEWHISHAAAYTVPTFFLSITFEFVFDEAGKVMGKHRYD